MRRSTAIAALPVLVTGVVLAVAAASAGEAPAPRVLPPAGPLLAWSDGEIARVDPGTLRLVGRRIPFGDPGATALSPDRRTLAIADVYTSVVHFVDVRSIRLTGATVDLGAQANADTIQWLDAGTLAVATWGDPPKLLTVDVAKRKVVAEHELPGPVFGRATAAGLLAVLAGPDDRMGASTLAVADMRRGVRSVTLRDVSSGYVPIRGARSGNHRFLSPGLAVEPQGRRAVVVPPGERVAEVDLADLRVEYHSLSQPVSLLGRFRNWLEPRALAKSIQGPERHARWIGDHTVVVTALEQVGIRTKQSEHRQLARATGVSLIDTRTWRVRRLSDAGGAAVTRGIVLLYGGPFSAGGGFAPADAPALTGLTGYTATGARRFRLFHDRRVNHVSAAGRYAYVVASDRTTDVVDVVTGKHVRTVRTPAHVFLLTP